MIVCTRISGVVPSFLPPMTPEIKASDLVTRLQLGLNYYWHKTEPRGRYRDEECKFTLWDKTSSNVLFAAVKLAVSLKGNLDTHEKNV